ncbi:MAG: ATP-binding protein [Thermoplasmata archaeon]
MFLFDKKNKKNIDDKVLTLEQKNVKGNYDNVLAGSIDIKDILSPSAVDTTNPFYVVIDGMYISTLLVVSYPYERPAAWLSDIINYGEGVELSIYYEPLDKSKIVKEITYMIGETGAKRKAIGDNQSDVDIVDTALGHAKYMRQAMNVHNEDPYYMYILICVYAQTKEKLEDRLRAVEGLLAGKDIMVRRADFRHEDGFIACLPLHSITQSLKKSTRRNALTLGVASTYPFVSSEFSDDNGVLIGINKHNNSLVIIDIFNTAIYKNANVVILGTSGAGKTFLLQLLAMRLRQQGIQVMIIAPLKGHEFRKACEAIGGTFVRIAPGSEDCINIFDIRSSSFEESFDGDIKNSLLLSKIQKLHVFFSLLFPDMTREEKQDLDEKLIELYRQKGITFDNESLYEDDIEQNIITTKRKFKNMPLLEDLYKLLDEDVKTKRLAKLMKMLVTGSMKAFNNHTNVNLNNKYIVVDISELNDELLPLGMFIAIDMLWDKIKEDRTKKKAIFIDEAWKLIGGENCKQAAQFVLEIFKIIRGYGGSAIAATQDVNDFLKLEGGKYSKGIINNSKLKFVLQLEEEEAETLQRIIRLSEEEIAAVTSFSRGQCLFYAADNHVAINVVASDEEKELITTDRAELEKIRSKTRASYQLTYEDDEIKNDSDSNAFDLI